jgi:hypothetical protein
VANFSVLGSELNYSYLGTWVEIPRAEKKPLPTDDCMQWSGWGTHAGRRTWTGRARMTVPTLLLRRADRLVQEGARKTDSRKQGS